MSQQVNLGVWHRLTQMITALIIIACLLGLFFWYLPVFQQNARMRKQIIQLEMQIKAAEETQKQLTASIQSLKEDPKTVERVARQKLGYAKPGETVIYFESPR